MNLGQFARRRYTLSPTPLEPLARLSGLLGGPNLFIKRDDHLGLAGGGSKTRKLEFLVADALACGADTLITIGAVQSNHCRLTAAAAAKEGLKCRLVLEERVPNSYKQDASGNNLLFKLLGVEKIQVVPAGTDVAQAMQNLADEVAAEGRNAYVIPAGGSCPLGATGYVACAEEMIAQSFEQSISYDCVVVTSGSGGTHAGLVVGFYGNNTNVSVIGINISRKKAPQESLVYDLANKTAAHVGIRSNIPREAVQCFEDYVGPGYSLPTAEMVKTVNLVAQTEGILLDPVYTGKAMGGLLDLVRKGVFKRGQNILFVHTGGVPALHGYSHYF